MTARTGGYVNLRAEYVTADDPGDPWGSCMEWLFAIAGTLAADGEDVPAAWRYSRSPIDHREVWELVGEVGDGDYAVGTVAGGYLAGYWTADDLRAFGEILSRYADWCRAAGRDY